MYLLPIAWIYVALMMAIAEATNSNGSVLGALVTFVLYGLLPVGLAVYLMGSSGRKKAARVKEDQAMAARQAQPSPSAGLPASVPAALPDQAAPGTGPSNQPDTGRHAPTDVVAPVRKEP